MAYLILLRNPLTPHEKEEHELAPGETPIEWLQKNYPDGFGMPIRYYVNADELPLDDLDRMPDADDLVIIALMPGGFLAAMPLLVKVVIGLAIMAASYFAMQLFAPKVKKQKTKEDKETYSISSDQNAAKYGDPIPVVYGDVWMTPDYVTQPHTWFEYEESRVDELLSGIQYLDLIMCVGQGEVDVSNIKLGNTDASTLGSVVRWRTFYPNEHNSQMGVISSAMGVRFFENVVTCPEVDNQEFIKAGDTSQFFTTCPPGQRGRYIYVDIVFPNGLYYTGGGGSMKGTACQMTVVVQEVDDNGNFIGPSNGTSFTTNTQTAVLKETKNAPEISNPVRRTYLVDTKRDGRWAVKILRQTNAVTPSDGMTTFVWSGLKMVVSNAPRAYGDVTLLAVRVKASRGIGSDAAVRISARCRRRMAGLPNGMWQHNTNATDAFYDVYTNKVYGASRPVSELDIPQLLDLRQKWEPYPFNYVFRDRSTVWEALKTITVGYAAEPLPLGSAMTIAQDGVKPVRSMLFTDANIVEGTMKVDYIFDIDADTDGIEVQYTSPQDWQESFTRYPANSVLPETVTLNGCTSATHAAQYARLVWQRTRGQRKRITFQTEMEGIILQLGDRIAISHEMPRWGDSGQVLGVRDMTITVDHDLDWSGGAKYMMFRKADGSPSDLFVVTQGSQPHIAVLGRPVNFTMHVDDDYDYTSFAFGAATTLIRDFTVAKTRHVGETTIEVEAVNYAPEIFDGAMTFLGGNP